MGKKSNNKLIKVIFIGDSLVGKTALIHRWLHVESAASPAHLTTYTETLGFDTFLKTATMADGNKITVQIWDTTGRIEQFAAVGAAFCRNVHCCVIVQDGTRHQSENQRSRVDDWRKQFWKLATPQSRLQAAGLAQFPFVVLNNKQDLVTDGAGDEAATNSMPDEIITNNLMPPQYFDTSALTGVGCAQAFQAIAESACTYNNTISDLDESELEFDRLSDIVNLKADYDSSVKLVKVVNLSGETQQQKEVLLEAKAKDRKCCRRRRCC